MLYLEEDLHKLLDMARKAEISPPSTLRPGIPPQLEKIVMHALAKAPGDRYQSASDFATDLERFLHAYSPVFNASKLTSVLRKVVGEPQHIPIEEAPAELRDGPSSTQPLPLDAVAHNKEEIRDENSVIFRMQDLDASGNKPRGVKPTPAAGTAKPNPTPPSGAQQVARAAGVAPMVPMRAPARTPPGAAPIQPKVPGALPSIAKPPAAASRPAMATPGSGRPVSGRQLDEETREMGPAPVDLDDNTSGLLTLEPSPSPPVHMPAAKSAPVGAPPLLARATKPMSQSAPPAPAPAKPAPAVWADTVDTQSLEDDLENIGERTQITAAPSGRTLAYPTPADASEDEVRYDSGPDATMITGSPRPPTGPDGELEDDTNPKVSTTGADEVALAAAIDAAIRKAGGAPSHDDDTPDNPAADDSDVDDEALTLGGNEPLDEDGPTMQRDFSAVPKAKPRTPRGKAAPPPALAAKIHTPAVSELRKPRPSRRTPPNGVAAQPQASVLQAIVGAQSSEPMPTPRPTPTPTAVTSPAPALEPAPTPLPQPPQLPPQPMAPAFAAQPHVQPSYPPQAYPPPQPYPMPYGTPNGSHPHPYPMPPPPSYPPSGYAPQMYQTPYDTQPPQPPPYGHDPSQPHSPYVSPGALYAYQPFGPPPTPPTLTGQLRLTEGDELPAHLQLGGGKRWFMLVFAGLLAVSAAAAATYFLLRATRDVAPTIGSIRVESSPPGAEISLDGQRLADPTPFTIEGIPVGTRHDIVVSLAHYTPDSSTVDVPKTGGETNVTAILKPVTGKLIVISSPPGAEIRIEGVNRGVTPKTITDVDMRSAHRLELRLKDYQVYQSDLKWPDSGELDLDLKLVK